ncbi:hypothetical protein [Pseudoroseicyclus tamaricis]|uniref:Transferrin-binding protein B C-lobe/N-lobe beta barrel domain-containing protein n=1 Tax=Pseudoroseicyclus tamaricis TaxID=2705421 RepID=A0A6B2JXW9_9RHOB|nr:hypothetical protein [Pseudoroseicyclus tamaricis]NDV01124.1 hypothetical protein [Pseudoroseicyclus tamaricis]
MKQIVPILAGLAACSLAACSSGSSDPTLFDDIEAGISAAPGTNAYYIELEDVLEDAIDEFPYQDPTTLPASGSADYSGFMELTVEDTVDVRGDLSMQVGFADNSISGDVSSMVGQSGDEVFDIEGTLAITNGVIDRDVDLLEEYPYSADLDGTLSGRDETYVVEAAMYGDFFDDHKYVGGVVYGTFSDDEFAYEITEGDFIGALD